MAMQHGTAGRSARAMADGRWFKVMLCAGGMLLVLILMLTNLSNIAKLGLPALIVLGVGFKFGIESLEKKALHLKKRAKDADRGALAEEKAAIRLQDLPDGYHSFHDIDFAGFNVDHAVVGPGGVFLIETKSHRGKVSAKGDMLLLNGKSPEKNFLKQTWSQTYHLKDFLWKQTSKGWDVKPVLCFTNAFVEVRRPVKGVTVTRLGYLNKLLAKQPRILGTEDVEKVVRVLQFWITRHEREGIGVQPKGHAV